MPTIREEEPDNHNNNHQSNARQKVLHLQMGQTWKEPSLIMRKGKNFPIKASEIHRKAPNWLLKFNKKHIHDVVEISFNNNSNVFRLCCEPHVKVAQFTKSLKKNFGLRHVTHEERQHEPKHPKGAARKRKSQTPFPKAI